MGNRASLLRFFLVNVFLFDIINAVALWRSGYAAVCKTAYTGSIPVGASIKKAARLAKSKTPVIHKIDIES